MLKQVCRRSMLDEAHQIWSQHQSTSPPLRASQKQVKSISNGKCWKWMGLISFERFEIAQERIVRLRKWRLHIFQSNARADKYLCKSILFKYSSDGKSLWYVNHGNGHVETGSTIIPQKRWTLTKKESFTSVLKMVLLSFQSICLESRSLEQAILWITSFHINPIHSRG